LVAGMAQQRLCRHRPVRFGANVRCSGLHCVSWAAAAVVAMLAAVQQSGASSVLLLFLGWFGALQVLLVDVAAVSGAAAGCGGARMDVHTGSQGRRQHGL
jgi:hypothetical protein